MRYFGQTIAKKIIFLTYMTTSHKNKLYTAYLITKKDMVNLPVERSVLKASICYDKDVSLEKIMAIQTRHKNFYRRRRNIMKRSMFILCLFVVFSFLTAQAGEAKKVIKADAKKIQGVWSLKCMDVGIGENRRTRDDAQFMVYIAKTHYSAIRDFTPKPAPGEQANPANRSFMADAGTYEFTGDELIVHHKIAAFPVLGSMTFKCYMEDDNLILEPQYDKMVMPGMEAIKPSADGKMGYGDMAVKYVFQRLE
jgi:hypothetical protein